MGVATLPDGTILRMEETAETLIEAEVYNDPSLLEVADGFGSDPQIQEASVEVDDAGSVADAISEAVSGKGEITGLTGTAEARADFSMGDTRGLDQWFTSSFDADIKSGSVTRCNFHEWKAVEDDNTGE